MECAQTAADLMGDRGRVCAVSLIFYLYINVYIVDVYKRAINTRINFSSVCQKTHTTCGCQRNVRLKCVYFALVLMDSQPQQHSHNIG